MIVSKISLALKKLAGYTPPFTPVAAVGYTANPLTIGDEAVLTRLNEGASDCNDSNAIT
ncbi:MAG: hypothetical protein HY287_01390 [Planctomycetes bacterium]|nr:hypothetical protein [Planctomycetota bacterium]MBI3832961.1 hypothetical protein [Planctomycetota bacterium]